MRRIEKARIASGAGQGVLASPLIQDACATHRSVRGWLKSSLDNYDSLGIVRTICESLPS